MELLKGVLILLCLPVVFFVLFAIGWLLATIFPNSGDDPRFLP